METPWSERDYIFKETHFVFWSSGEVWAHEYMSASGKRIGRFCNIKLKNGLTKIS